MRKSYPLSRVEFHGQQIEAAVEDDQIWIILRRICQNLDLDYPTQWKKIKEDPMYLGYVRNIPINYSPQGGWSRTNPPPGNVQETFCINLEGFLLWLGSIQTKRVKESSQEALIKYKQECARVLREHFFPSKGQSQDPLLASLEAIVQMRKEQLELNRRQSQIEASQQRQQHQLDQVTTLVHRGEERREAAVANLTALPSSFANADVAEKTPRFYLNERLRLICLRYDLTHREVYNKLYREFRDREHIDIKALVRNRRKKKGQRKVTGMDIAEEICVVEQLYNLSCQLWGNVDAAREVLSVAK